MKNTSVVDKICGFVYDLVPPYPTTQDRILSELEKQNNRNDNDNTKSDNSGRYYAVDDYELVITAHIDPKYFQSNITRVHIDK